jgi:hypothetical protein
MIHLTLGTHTLPLWAVARDISAAQLGRDDRSWRVLQHARRGPGAVERVAQATRS